MASFLELAKAGTISDFQLMDMSNDEVIEIFEQLRWADTNGEPVCPTCGGIGAYIINTKSKSGKPIKRYKCKQNKCRKQFTVTSGTLFAYHKKPLKHYLYAMLNFVNGAKGQAALPLKAKLGATAKTTFVMLHKFRAALFDNANKEYLEGVVEMDGCYTNGYTRPENKKEDRLDLRLAQNQNPNKRCVLAGVQRADENSDLKGSVAVRACVTKFESNQAINNFALETIKKNSTIQSDGAPGYNDLEAWYDSVHGDHSSFYSGDNGECTNQVESFFSRFKRMRVGIHHHLSNLYLSNYVNECAWREENRRVDNKTKLMDLARICIQTATHNEWCGYWQGNKRNVEVLAA